MSYRSTVLGTAGLQSLWLLEESTGTAPADSKGAVTGAVTATLTQGVTGHAAFSKGVEFAGGKIDFGDVYDFAANAAFSVEFFIYRESGSTDANYRRPITKEPGTFDQSWCVMVAGSGAAHPHELVLARKGGSAGASDELGTGTTTPLTTWTHFVGTYDGTNLRVYINGSLAAGPLASSRSLSNLTTTLQLGRVGSSSTEAFFGILDDVAIYNVALDATTIAAHYAARDVDTEADVYNESVEVLRADPTPNATIYNESAEVLRADPTPNARTFNLSVEVLTPTVSLVGSASGAGSGSGSISGPAHLTGSASGAGSASGVLGSTVLKGAVTATSSASGTLGAAVSLTGSASAAGSALGFLNRVALIGDSSAAASATVTLTALARVTGSSSGAGSGSGILTPLPFLTGSAFASGSGSGTLSYKAKLTGASTAAAVAVGFMHRALPPRLTSTFLSRWASGEHIGAARPTLKVEIRAGRFNRRYAPWFDAGIPIDAVIGDSDPAAPWQAFWEPTEAYVEVPNVRQVELATNFDQKGIASAVITIDNIVYQSEAGGQHSIHRGYLAPLRGYVAAGRDTLTDERGTAVAENEWFGKFSSKYQITVHEGYGDQMVKTFTGLIDDVDATSNPAVLTVNARSFGQVFSDEEFFGWDIDKNLRDPVVFIDKDDADNIVKAGYTPTASSDDGTHTVDLVNDGDSDTFWRSQSHTTWTVTEYVEVLVGEGRYSDFYLGPEYADLDVYVSVLPRSLADGSNPTLNGGDLTPDTWVDLSMGSVPGTFGGVPYIRLFNRATTDTLVGDMNATAGEGGLFPGGEFAMGSDSIVRLSFRNLWDAGGANFYAAVRSFYPRKRSLVADTGADKWVRVGDISDVVKVVCRWAGFKEWDIESTGARLGKRLLANRGMKYMDLIDKVKDGVGYEFFIADPTEVDESIGIPTFRQTRIVQTGAPTTITVTDRDLVTAVDLKETDENKAYIIRARGRTSKTGETLGGDSTKRIMYEYRPPWSGLRSGGVIRHVIHTNELFKTMDDVRFAAWYIALQEAIESAAVGFEIPAYPDINLDDLAVLEDLGTGLTTRVSIRERRSTSVAGENASWTMTLTGALIDVPDVQTVVALIGGSRNG